MRCHAITAVECRPRCGFPLSQRVYALFLSFLSLVPADYSLKWRHPQTHKYISYRDATRGGQNSSRMKHAVGKNWRSLRNWFLRYAPGPTDIQTNTHTQPLQYFLTQYRGEIMTLLRKELDNLNYIGLRRSRCCSCVSLSFCIRFYNTITASKYFQIAFAYVNSPTRPLSRTSLGFFDRTTYPLLSSR